MSRDTCLTGEARKATTHKLQDGVNLSSKTRVAVSEHISHVNVRLRLGKETRIVDNIHNPTFVARIHRGVSQRLAIAEQVAVESVFVDTVHLGRTASVVDSTMSHHTQNIVLVENHLLVAREVIVVEVRLVVAVQFKVARVHDLLASALGFSQISLGTSFILRHILAVATFIEANLGFHSQSHPLVEGSTRRAVHRDVGASEVEIFEHLVHHVVTRLTGTVQNIFVARVEFLVNPVAVTITTHHFVVLPCTIQAAYANPVVLAGITHGIDARNGSDEGVGTTNLSIGSAPGTSRCGNSSEGPLGDTGCTLVIVQVVEVVVTTT